jgi:DNA mismatch repair protein MutL
MPELTKAGFDIEEKKNHTIIMKGLPADAKDMDVQQFIDILIEDLESEADEIINKIDEKLARSLAGNSAIKYGKELSPDEMKELFDKLFACEMPNFSPSGKTILDIINYDDIEQRLN